MPILLVALAACTVQVGEGAKPSALVSLVGENGLLVDPAAAVHRPSLDVTLSRLAAARILGVSEGPSPDPTMVKQLLKQASPEERPELRLKWGYVSGEPSQTSQAIKEASSLCPLGKAAAPSGGIIDCTDLLKSMWAFLNVSQSTSMIPFESTFPEKYKPACPPSLKDLVSQYVAVLCGKKNVSGDEVAKAVAALAEKDRFLSDSRSLWTASAVVTRIGADPSPLRKMTVRAVSSGHVKGIFFDEIPAQGTLLTTWALLHLARSDMRGLDAERLTQTVLAQDPGSAPDRRMLVRANLALLHHKGGPAPTRGLTLSDPDGPYNPFIALAARDSGDLAAVSLGFSKSVARATRDRFASYVVTQRIVSGASVPLTSADVSLLRSLLKEDGAVGRPSLLAATALAAGGQATDIKAWPVGCSGAPWLVTAPGNVDTCDLRSSLLMRLHQEFVAPQRTP